MTVIATQDRFSRFSSLVKGGDTPEQMAFFKDAIVINEAGTPTIKLGTVLGKVTATGKWKVCVETAVDGSKVPAGIYIADSFGAVADTVMVAATDTKALALVRGKIVVAKDALRLDATYDNATKLQTAYDALKAIGILAEASN